MKFLLSAIFLVFSISSASTPTSQPNDAELAARMLEAINTARVENGLPPYALNPLLTQAAQAHSEYQMQTGEISHIGPGEMTAMDRVAQTGYPAIRVNENIYAGGMLSSPEDAVEWWITADEAHNRNVLHPELREAGIGAATNMDGWTYYTLDISAQPNVLPMFINSDDTATTFPDVVITLTNETVFYGSAQLATVTQVMISNSPDFAGATLVAWAPFVNWTLDVSKGAGAKTVYVRYMDASGRSADAQDRILFDPHGTLASTETVSMAITPSATTTLTPEPSLVPTSTERVIVVTATSPPMTAVAEAPTAAPIVITVPVAAPPDTTHTIRTLFAGIFLGAILTIVVGILILMRRLRA